MATIAATPSVVKDIVDNAEERELWIVGREFERPPYFIAGKGGDTRLARALRLCVDDKITPNSDGSYSVEGSHGRSYRVGDSCSCPNSQKASTKWCYHAVGVALYVEWQKRLRPVAPVALGTLRAGTLPLPPVTVEERLALGTIRDNTALSTSHVPQEDGYEVTQEELMASEEADDAQDIPEPHVPPVAVADAPERKEEKKESHRPLPGPVLVPELAPVKIPREYTVNIKGKMHVLYTGLVVAARTHGLTSLSADWTYNDAELSLAHAVCTFADGRRYEESGDATPGNVNKGVSLHFRRVALTRAKARCLRDALGISECSVEEMADDAGKAHVPDMTPPPSETDLRRRIWTRVKELAPEATTRESVTRVIMERTGLALHPDHYQDILRALET